MTKHYYTGVSAILEDNEDTHFRLRALSTAIRGLSKAIDQIPGESFVSLNNIVTSAAFHAVQDFEHLFAPAVNTLPENTPEPFGHTHTRMVDVDGENAILLYIPVVSPDRRLVKEIVENALYTVLLVLFSENLMTIETKSGIHTDDFEHFSMELLYR